MASKGQKFRKYSPELKRKVVQEYLNGKTDILALAYENDIASQESIVQWVKNYRLYGEDSFIDKRGVATSENAPLKGRPRKYFNNAEEKAAYMTLVTERNKKRAAEKRRLSKIRRRRAARKALEEAQQAAKIQSTENE